MTPADLLTTGLRIGPALKRARTDQSIDIATAEARTKIRTKYLRALEAEEWDVLPGATYAKGYLRTYAGLLGLDAEALVDEYRRQVEVRDQGRTHAPAGQRVLEGRRRPGQPPSRRGPVLAVAALAAVAVVAALVIAGSGGEGNGRHAGKGRHRAHAGTRHHGQKGNAAGGHRPAGHAHASGPVTLKLVALQGIQACLVRGTDQPVIDSQSLSPGSPSGPFQGASRYRLDLETGGSASLQINGRRTVVRAPRSASFSITAAGAREIDFKGPHCP